jgi:predicted acylesterase/phospholipase RssA
MLKNIVLAGGGFKCWAYIGTIRALEEYNIKGSVEHVVGVSAGSIFGLMYILGAKWEFLLNFFINLNFQELYDIDIDNVLMQQSLFAGLKFNKLIKELVTHFIDPDLTFMELHKHSRIKFTVNALNITESKLEYFNFELTPETKVLDAVMASSRLPVVLPPYVINGKSYYDGGLCNNCPIDFIEDEHTLAFDVSCYSKKNTSQASLLNLLNTFITMCNKPKERENLYNILDESFKDEMINLNQTRDDIFNIYMTGYINSKDILFKNYIALPSS